jgi:hypothetical protein
MRHPDLLMVADTVQDGGIAVRAGPLMQIENGEPVFAFVAFLDRSTQQLRN